jgi:hypothetical protein
MSPSPFAGTWSGTYEGGDTGTWTFEISEVGIFVSGSSYSNNAMDTQSITSLTINPDGSGTSVAENGTTTEFQMTGDDVEGTWENTAAGISGTLLGSKE